jgi:hypothetical protein
MTSEEDTRISELAKLIEAEKDPEKLVSLATELEHLLTLRLNAKKTPPIADKKQ